VYGKVPTTLEKSKTAEQAEKKTTEPQTGSGGSMREDKGPVWKTGNLTRDPELRFGASGKAYARTAVAVETPKTPGDWAGEREVTFYEVVCFGTLAENVAQSLTKGMRVVVAGRAELEHWTDGNGEKRTAKHIIADGFGPDLRWVTCEVIRPERTSPATAREAYDEAPF